VVLGACTFLHQERGLFQEKCFTSLCRYAGQIPSVIPTQLGFGDWEKMGVLAPLISPFSINDNLTLNLAGSGMDFGVQGETCPLGPTPSVPTVAAWLCRPWTGWVHSGH
jgi:hypothetical protein